MELVPSVFFLGASGQTGGPLLTVFREKYPKIPITVLLRTTALDTAIQALGSITTVHSDFSDLETIKELSSNHNIILNCATSMNVHVTKAILRGTRDTKTQKKPILFHLSGAGNLVDSTTSGSYNDGNPEDVRKISAAMLPNGQCDELILKATTEGYVNALFVCPGGIYGTSANYIGMLDNVVNLGFSPYVGNGTAVFRTVHVDDVVDIMMLVFQKALDTWSSYKPEDDVAPAFADVVYHTGRISALMVKSVPYEEAGTVAKYLGGNMLLRDDNARSLGWKPKAPGFFETLKQIK